jgi:hypothetical protein
VTVPFGCTVQGGDSIERKISIYEKKAPYLGI